jgi:hypothetical protein
VLQGIQGGKQDTKAFQEAIFIKVPAAAVQQIHIQKLSPENKGALPLQAPCKQFAEARSKV